MPMYKYVCNSCEYEDLRLFKFDERPDTVKCTECGEVAEHRIGAPAMIVSKYDKNGRVGYRIDSGNGKIQHRSATRMNYEHRMGNESTKALKKMPSDEKSKGAFTKEYQRVEDTKKKEKEVKLKKAVEQIKRGSSS